MVRKLVHIFAFAGTFLIGVLAIALIVSQTPWFRDWIRRYIVRESKQYLNGELSIGAIGGNLLFGVQVIDVAVDLSGERVVAARSIEVDYSIFEILSRGAVIDGITLVEPVVRLERTGDGWNLGQLVKEREKEAEREGPGTPISLQAIEVRDARVRIEDHTGASGYTLPEEIEDFDLRASYEYEPVHYSIVVDSASIRTRSPQLALTELAGKIAVRDENLYIEGLSIRTGESSLSVDGVVENYLDTPVVKVTTTGSVSMPEIGRVVPAASGYQLHPRFDIRANGPTERLALNLDVRTEAGNVRGQLTTDVKAPGLAARGAVNVESLNLAPILKDPEQKSDITGRAELDLTVASSPESAPVTDRMGGTFSFTGPTVVAAGYRASDVRVTGAFDGPRLQIDGRALAYGGTATARGSITLPAEKRPLALDLRGAADGVDLTRLPASTGAPQLESDLSIAEYHLIGQGTTISGSATLNESTVEGATIAEGTVADFRAAPDGISYAARGRVIDLNLPRMGRALKVAALDNPAYDGSITGDFDVNGSVPRAKRTRAGDDTLASMSLEAKGTLRDSTIMGGRLPELAFDAQLAGGGLSVSADGRFEGFDPATLANREALKGNVTGQLDVRAEIGDITAPITPEAIAAAGTVALEGSEIGGLKIDAAHVNGKYDGNVADLAELTLSGPDLKLNASGQLALNRTASSNLKYHVEAVNLATLAELAGQSGVTGSATVDGTVSGNAETLQTSGTLNGSDLGYGDNTALDLNTAFHVTLPDLAFKEVKVEADTTATFVKAGGLEINTLTARTSYAGDRLSFTTNIKEERRELDATGELIIHTDHQEVHLPMLAVRTQGVEWRTAPGAEAVVQYGQDRIELHDVRLVSGDQSLEVAGAFALKGDVPAGELTVAAKNVDLPQLEQVLLMERGVAGRLSADATISGTAQSPAVDGHVEIANGGFQKFQYESLVADVKYAADRIDVDALLRQAPGISVDVEGTMPRSLFRPSKETGHVPATDADRVDLRIKSSELNLGIVEGFTNQLANVTGTLQADLQVTGSGQDPHVVGYVDIRNGAFGVPATGVSYTGLDTRIQLQPDKVALEKFVIRDEEGQPLYVSGDLAVHARKVGAVNVAINADNFEIIDNELGDVGIDSEITVTGEMRRPSIQGKIRVDRGRLEVDNLLALFYDPYAVESLPPVGPGEEGGAVREAGSAEEATTGGLQTAENAVSVPGAREQAGKEGEGPAPGGALSPLALDLRVIIPDNLVLRGDNLRPGGPTGVSIGDMNITIGGELQIVKPAGGQMSVLGTIQTIRGQYQFQGRRFALERGGTIRFTGEPQPNPTLDITATRVIPNTGVEARVQIGGTVRKPQLTLTSTPPLEESDILALIVFNRPVNELGTGERASLASTAGGIASGFLAAPLGESIGRALDLDLFEITTTTESGDLGAGLTLGQQIGDKAFFSLRQQFGDRSITEFLIEYQISQLLRVQATAAPETSGAANRIGQRRIERAGIDFIFFFSY